MNESEKLIYKLGWILPPAGGITAILLHYFPILQHPCILHTFTGIYCPGCGGTRAVIALLHGHILRSLYYHPFVPYFALLYILYMTTWTITQLTRRKLNIGLHFRYRYLYIGLAIILINWILRNTILPLP